MNGALTDLLFCVRIINSSSDGLKTYCDEYKQVKEMINISLLLKM